MSYEGKGRILKDSIPYNGDQNGNIIPGGSKIVEIINTATNTSTYVAITTTKPAKQIQMTMADGTSYYLSNVSAGTTSQKIPANTVLTWAGGFDAGTLFYIKGTAGTPKFEVVVID